MLCPLQDNRAREEKDGEASSLVQEHGIIKHNRCVKQQIPHTSRKKRGWVRDDTSSWKRSVETLGIRVHINYGYILASLKARFPD